MESRASERTGAVILSIATHVPDNYVTTDEMLATFGERLSPGKRKMLGGMHIRGRHSVVEGYAGALAAPRELRVCDTTTGMAVSAARRCMAQGGFDPSEVGLLIAATNTPDRQLPCLAYEVLSRLGERFPRDINVLNMVNQGCSVVPKTLEIASHYLRCHPTRRALVVTSEGLTSYLLPNAEPGAGAAAVRDPGADRAEAIQRLIASFLFGDGAVAFLLGSEGSGVELGPFSHCTNLEEADQELLTLEDGRVLRPPFTHFPYYQMSKDVPRRGAEYAKKCATDLRRSPSVQEGAAPDFDSCLIHTGSLKILDGVCDALGIAPRGSQVRSSYGVLNRYGNLSAASIGFILHDHLKTRPEGEGLMLTFGAGFSASAGVVRYRREAPPFLS